MLHIDCYRMKEVFFYFSFKKLWNSGDSQCWLIFTWSHNITTCSPPNSHLCDLFSDSLGCYYDQIKFHLQRFWLFTKLSFWLRCVDGKWWRNVELGEVHQMFRFYRERPSVWRLVGGFLYFPYFDVDESHTNQYFSLILSRFSTPKNNDSHKLPKFFNEIEFIND